ncbi:MAG: response regulator transcription factor [Coriobacteriales bacterium]|jgi:two-component system alkaline phosphatase synthesis response regulator PhoP
MIYYLEDDEQIRNLTIYTLAQTDHETMGFARPSEMYKALETQIPDLFLLDIMLPEESGLSVLENLRNRPDTKDVPIMMITAKSTEFDTVTGLDAGADDYLTKPYGMMEMVSRVNALLRRSKRAPSLSMDGVIPASTANQPAKDNTRIPSEPIRTDKGGIIYNEVFDAGPIHLDVPRHTVSVDGVEVNLTRKEFQMLLFLMENRGIVLSRGQILDKVWGYSVVGQTRTVDAHMQTLRKKLSEVNRDAAAMLETVRGVGYRLTE